MPRKPLDPGLSLQPWSARSHDNHINTNNVVHGYCAFSIFFTELLCSYVSALELHLPDANMPREDMALTWVCFSREAL
jgi:hypothetical protein